MLVLWTVCSGMMDQTSIRKAQKSLGWQRKESSLHSALKHKVSVSIWWPGKLWNAVTGLYRAITSVIPTTWCKRDERHHHTIILTFPFPRHPHFVLLTPDYVSLCTGINTSRFLIAAAPWKEVREDHNVAFDEAVSQRCWFNSAAQFLCCSEDTHTHICFH